ncbi:MAG: DoxX family protein [Thalassobius sp.]|nr:DoxX family protein [Thalassovita sp.]
MQKENLAYLLARLPIGFSFLGHGFIRIPKISVFAEGMAGAFSASILPYSFVLAFAYILPFVELLLGILLISGIAMRKVTIAGTVLICILIFGSSIQENWSAVSIQMFYGLYLSILFLFAEYNGYSITNNQKTI